MIIYKSEGGALVPLNRFEDIFNAEFEVGKLFRMEEVESRDMVSHQHYFATIREHWTNLPERYEPDHPTPTHLRKWALIETGWYDKEAIVMKSPDSAAAVASYARRDEFALVIVDDRVVNIYRAKSQKTKHMNAKNFQRSKWDVLNFLDDLIGVNRGETAANAGQSA